MASLRKPTLIVALKLRALILTLSRTTSRCPLKPVFLRGLHFQRSQAAQTKLIRVVTGTVLDVIVDLRKDSPTYKQREGYILSASNHRQLLVPRGFAYGFLTLTDNVNFVYKCDNYYDAEADGRISFKTPELNIDWPIEFDKAVTSEKDAKQLTLTEFVKDNPFVYVEI